MSLVRIRQEWNELGWMDPYWAILTNPAGKFGNWNIEEFFAFGEQEIKEVINKAKELGYPQGWDSALDFGCGVGRLTRALGKHFGKCYGVDISENMLAQARQLNQSLSNASFLLNTQEDLRLFKDNAFDMIYTNLVLQHLPRRSTIRHYISEFVRTLKRNGLLVFQLLSHIPLRNRIQPRRRLYAALRTFGVNERFLYCRLRLHPLRIHFIPPGEVIAFLKQIGAKVLEVRVDPGFVSLIQSRIYFVTK